MFGIISDTHLHAWSAFSRVDERGVNNRLTYTLDQFEGCAGAVREAGGRRIYHAGDLFHVRGNIAPSVLNPSLERIQEVIDKYQVEFRIIAGNHDLESKDSCEIGNAARALSALQGVEIISETTVFEDDKVVMIPWFDSVNALRDEICNAINSINESAGDSAHRDFSLVIHAPVNGVILGIPDHGLDGEELAELGFKNVFAGHYHDHKMVADGVWSVGATTHQTWSDVNTKAGFLLVNGKSVNWFKSTAPEFIDYNEDWSESEAAENCAGNYVRVRMGEATESEIHEIRRYIIDNCQAEGCIVQATPKRVGGVRGEAEVSSGESLVGSIAAWLKANDVVGDHKAITRECEEILAEAEA